MEQNQKFSDEATENPLADSLPPRNPLASLEQGSAPPPREAGFAEKWDFYTRNLKWTLSDFFARLKKPVDTIYAVGVDRYYEGDIEDAAMRFRLVTRFRKDNAQAWYFLGSCEMFLGNDEQAIAAFQRALALNPQYEEAQFRLAIVAPHLVKDDHKPRYVPLSLVVEQADTDAIDYDQIHLSELGYRGHEAVFQAVARHVPPGVSHIRLLDIGCGTGLVGLQFRSVSARIEGVDVSRNMLYAAEQRRDDLARRIYDEVHMDDLRRFLLQQPADNFDVITAANVLPFVGGLSPVFDGVRHSLRAGGLFSFSVEAVDGQEFGLIPGTGRFGHSDQYIRELAARAGLDVLEVEPFEIYFEEEAVQYTLRKAGGQQQPAAAVPPVPPVAPQG